MALAKFGQFPNDLLVMVINNNGIVYYDDQKIFIPKNKCAIHFLDTYNFWRLYKQYIKFIEMPKPPTPKYGNKPYI